MRSRRVLITGLATHWGGRLAQAIERDPEVETIIGVDAEDPRVELERTEYVRVGTEHALLRRIVMAAEIDTVIDSRLVVDSTAASAGAAHENNVIGTMNILAACAGKDSPVRQVVFKSTAHWYGCEQDDPAFFTEAMRRPHPPGTGLERDVVEAESAVSDFAARHPGVSVAVLRFTNVLGAGVDTAHTRWLGLPGIPAILGFDPRYQFIHEDDVVGCLEHAVREDLEAIVQLRRRRGARALGATPACSRSRSCPSCRRGGRRWPPPPCAAPAWASRARCSTRCASAAPWTTGA